MFAAFAGVTAQCFRINVQVDWPEKGVRMEEDKV